MMRGMTVLGLSAGFACGSHALAQPLYQADDGSWEVLVTSGTEQFLFGQAYEVSGGYDQIISLHIGLTGGLPPDATMQALLYDDPNDDGDLQDAVLLMTADFQHPGGGHQVIDVPIPTTNVSGTFFVAGFLEYDTIPGIVLADGDAPFGDAWIASSVGDIADLSSSDLQPPATPLDFATRATAVPTPSAAAVLALSIMCPRRRRGA